MLKTRLLIHNDDVLLQQKVERPKDTLSAVLFTQYDEVPAPLCDGGDYHHELSIRIVDRASDNPMVQIRWKRHENDRQRHTIKMPWLVFWEAIVAAAERARKGSIEE